MSSSSNLEETCGQERWARQYVAAALPLEGPKLGMRHDSNEEWYTRIRY
jgi:hypothetical protein